MEAFGSNGVSSAMALSAGETLFNRSTEPEWTNVRDDSVQVLAILFVISTLWSLARRFDPYIGSVAGNLMPCVQKVFMHATSFEKALELRHGRPTRNL